MHEILILYLLTKNQSTLYGLAKNIIKYFGHITNPSFGTLQPAIKRLEKKGCVTSSKFFSDGGKPYFYYSITDSGKDFLVNKLKSKPSKNPIQLCPEIKIKLSCCDVLSDEEKKEFFTVIKTELLKLKTEAEHILTSELHTDNFCGKMVLDNSVCEYKNLYELTERLEKHACKS